MSLVSPAFDSTAAQDAFPGLGPAYVADTLHVVSGARALAVHPLDGLGGLADRHSQSFGDVSDFGTELSAELAHAVPDCLELLVACQVNLRIG